MTNAWLARTRQRLSRNESLVRIARNTGWLLAGKGFGAILSIFYLALITRSLGPEQFGQFTLIFGLAQAIVAFVGFQTWRIVIRFGTQAYIDQDASRLNRLILFCIILDIGGAIIGCMLAVLAVWLLAPHFGWSADLACNALIFAIIMLVSIRSTAVGILRLHDRFRDGAVADAAMPATRMAGAAFVAWVGSSVTGFLMAWAAAEIVTAFAYWHLVAKYTDLRLRGHTVRALLHVPVEHAGLWHFALLTNLGSTLATASQQFALLSVGFFAGPAAAGFFRLAHQLGQALVRLADMLSRALFAELSRVRASYGGTAMRALILRTNRIAIIGGIIVVVLIVTLGKPALHGVAGAAYLPAYPLLVVLGCAAAVELIGVSFEPTLLSVGKAGLALIIRAAATVILVALLAAMLPLYGEFGAAAATLGAALVSLFLFRAAAYRVSHHPDI